MPPSKDRVLLDLFEIVCPDGAKFNFELYERVNGGKFVKTVHPDIFNSSKVVSNLEFMLLQREGFLYLGEGEYMLVCTSHPGGFDPKLYQKDELYEIDGFFVKKFPGATITTVNDYLNPLREVEASTPAH